MRGLPSFIADKLRLHADVLKDPVARIADGLLQRWLMAWAGKEALIVVGLTAVLMVLSWIAPLLEDPEPVVFAACVVVLLYIGHVLMHVPDWVRFAVPLLRLRLGPRRLARAALTLALIQGLDRAVAALRGELTDTTLGSIGVWVADQWQTRPTSVTAWHLAERIEPLLWRYVLRAAALALLPLLLLIWGFRSLVTYGVLLDGAAHVGFREALVYPFATVIDLIFGTELRAMLVRP